MDTTDQETERRQFAASMAKKLAEAISRHRDQWTLVGIIRARKRLLYLLAVARGLEEWR